MRVTDYLRKKLIPLFWGICFLFFFATDSIPQQATNPAQDQFAGDIHYIWKQNLYAYLNGKKTLFFSPRMPKSKIALVDIDGDDDLDMFIGDAKGTLAYAENNGTGKTPDFEVVSRFQTYLDKRDLIRPIHFDGPIAPLFMDDDDDGDYDLFILDNKSTLHRFQNTGTPKNPVFETTFIPFLQVDDARLISAVFSDLNGDGLDDFVYGTADGVTAMIPNTGRIGKPVFTNRAKILITFPDKTEISPFIEDWDQDGKKDLFIGTTLGSLNFFHNVGTVSEPFFEQDKPVFPYESDIYGSSAPVFGDINGDGAADLFVGNSTDKIRFYESRTSADGKRSLWNVSENFLHFASPINVGSHSSVISKDVNADGRDDLLVAEGDGRMNLYINQNPNKNYPNYFQVSYNLIPKIKESFSIPELGDLNGDGFPDMLICIGTGQLIYLLHNQNRTEPGWNVESYNFYNLSGRMPCIPRLIDFDYDGDLDLFISYGDGKISFFDNIGSAEEPKMIEADFPYGEWNYGQFVAPAFIDWRRNGVYSMILGAESALKIIKDPLEREYQAILQKLNKSDTVNSDAFTQHTPDSLSFMPMIPETGMLMPYVSDLNNDGEPDILFGTDEGHIISLINTGYELYTPLPKVTPQVIENLPPVFDTGKVIARTKLRRAAVTVGDIDGDRDTDIIIGDENGGIYLLQNFGDRFEPEFSENVLLRLFSTGLENTSPVLYDLDGDGDLDLLIGDKQGQLHLYENIGTQKTFNFAAINGLFTNFRVGKNAVPSVYKSRTGTISVVTGDIFGRLNLIQGQKLSGGVWRFNLINRITLDTDVGIGSSPFVGDMDIDRIPEIIIGSDTGSLSVLKSEGAFLETRFTAKNDYAPNQNLPPGTFPALTDFDLDLDTDLVVGTEDGTVILFTNISVNE